MNNGGTRPRTVYVCKRHYEAVLRDVEEWLTSVDVTLCRIDDSSHPCIVCVFEAIAKDTPRA